MSKILDQEAFAAHMEAATRRAGYTVEKREGSKLHVVLNGQTVRCDLKTAYQAYKGAPHRLDDVVDAHLSALKQVPPLPPPPTEKEAAESLLPMLQRTQWLEETTKRTKAPLVHRPFLAGMVIAYIFDYPTMRAYMNESMAAPILEKGGTLDQIHEYALQNLRLRVKGYQYDTHGSLNELMITCETPDGHAATSILLPELVEGWARRIPGQILIGIPNRDFVIAFSDRHPAGVKALTRQVQLDARQRQHPLASRLLSWRDGKLREYQPLH